MWLCVCVCVCVYTSSSPHHSSRFYWCVGPSVVLVLPKNLLLLLLFNVSGLLLSVPYYAVFALRDHYDIWTPFDRISKGRRNISIYSSTIAYKGRVSFSWYFQFFTRYLLGETICVFKSFQGCGDIRILWFCY